MLRFLLILVFFFYISSLANTTEAKKVLPQAKSGKKLTFRAVSSGITTSAKLRADKGAVIISFANLQNAKSVSYSLFYETNGQQEGAGGTITPTGSTATRELLFGTCSKNVCRYHTNISNARLEINSSLKNGKISIKRYRIKV